MQNSSPLRLVVLLCTTFGITIPGHAGEREILSAIKQYFDVDDLDQRQGRDLLFAPAENGVVLGKRVNRQLAI